MMGYNDFDSQNDEKQYYEQRAKRRTTAAQRSKARRIRRIRNRTILLSAAILIIILIILGISSLFKSCSSGEKDDVTEPNTTASVSDNETEPPTDAPASASAVDFITPSVTDDGTTGSYSSNIYIYKNAGYATFVNGENSARLYSDSLSSYASALKAEVPNIKIYNILAPNSTEMKLPVSISSTVMESDSQSEFIKSVYTALDGAVTPVNVYNTLAEHNGEYIYYNTDKHWTALGAYYAYKEFCGVAGLESFELTDVTKNSVSGFTGDFAVITGSTALNSNPDTVDYYDMSAVADTDCTVKTSNSEDAIEATLYYPASTSGEYTYGVFIWADNPLFTISTTNTTGRNAVLVKDSYGNPFAPLLSASYDNIYVIDYRKWDGNLPSFCKENNITDVIFLNEVSNAASSSQVETLDTIF